MMFTSQTSLDNPIYKREHFKTGIQRIRDRCKIYTCKKNMTIAQQKRLFSQEQINRMFTLP